MFCPHCGAPNNDNAAFCMKCGYRVTSEPAQQPAQPAQQPSTPPMPAVTPVSPVPPMPTYAVPPVPPMDPVQQTVRGLVSSPLFLIAAILLSVALFLSLISTVTAPATYSAFVNGFLEAMEPEMDTSEIEELVSSMSGGMTAGLAVGLVPSGLLVAGLWMVYASAKDKLQPRMKTGGLSLIKGITIYNLVVICLCALLFLLFALLFILVLVVGGSSMTDTEMADMAIASVFIIPALLFCAGLLAIFIVYYVKLLKTITTIRTTIETGIPSSRISMLVIVMCFVTGVLSLSNLLSAAVSILFGVLLLKYRDAMRRLETMPMAAPPMPVMSGNPVI